MYSLLHKETKMPTGRRLLRPLYHGVGAPELLVSLLAGIRLHSGSPRQQISGTDGLPVKVIWGLLDPKASNSTPRGWRVYHGSHGTTLCMKSRSPWVSWDRSALQEQRYWNGSARPGPGARRAGKGWEDCLGGMWRCGDWSARPKSEAGHVRCVFPEGVWRTLQSTLWVSVPWRLW